MYYTLIKGAKKTEVRLMNIMVVGGGGREHAIIKKIKEKSGIINERMLDTTPSRADDDAVPVVDANSEK